MKLELLTWCIVLQVHEIYNTYIHCMYMTLCGVQKRKVGPYVCVHVEGDAVRKLDTFIVLQQNLERRL